ncbi:MAG: hypothetical protein CL920_38145 [Deltaproteobacteria bacterium]|nr:hypothetical protein [Deltaproteobacteria bacterium]
MLTLVDIPAQRDVSRFRNELEAQWATFFTTWGVRFRYSPGMLNDDEGTIVPAFFIPSVRVWIDVRERCHMERYEEFLEAYVPFVNRSQEAVLTVFGAPLIRAPEHQGWGLRRQGERLVAFPFHFMACGGCGGFCAASLGSASFQQEEPARYQQLLARIATLEDAYDEASSVRMFLN